MKTIIFLMMLISRDYENYYIIYENNERVEKIADYFKIINEVQGIKVNGILPDTFHYDARLFKNKFKNSSIVFMGTEKSNFWKSFLYKYFPFLTLQEDTIILKDTALIMNDYVINIKIPSLFNDTREFYVIIGNSFSDILVSREPERNQIIINRKRNGMMYLKEYVAIGSLREKEGKFYLEKIEWFQPVAPEKLKDLISGNIALFYDTTLINSKEAFSFWVLLSTIYNSYKILYNLIMPDTIWVYVYKSFLSQEVPFNLYSQPFGIIWLKVANREEFLGSPQLVFSLSHEFARITFQPFIKNSEKRYPLSIGADDWSHYAPLMGTAPYIYEHLKERAWFGKFTKEVYERWGPERFKKWYKGGENTFCWILYRIDKNYSKRIIGESINEIKNYKFYGHPDVYEFMKKLILKTKNKNLIDSFKYFIPTPFEHSLTSRHRWKSFGFYPRLEEMFQFHNFVVDSVEKFSPADKVGILPGDKIIEIEGFDVNKDKANCYKNLLFKKNGDKIRIKIKRGKKFLYFFLKVRK